MPVTEEVKIVFKMLDEVTPGLKKLQDTLSANNRVIKNAITNIGTVGQAINRDFGTTAKTLRKMGYQIDHTTGNFKTFRGQLVATDKVVAHAKAEMTHFRMEFLSIMFGAMQVRQSLMGLVSPAIKTAGVFELWGTTLTIVFLPITMELLRVLMPILSALMSMSDSIKLLLGGFALLGVAIFTLIMWGAQLMLFMNGVTKLFLMLQASGIKLGGSLLLISQALIILVVILAVLYLTWKTNWGGMKSILDDAVGHITGTLSSLGKFLESSFSGNAKASRESFGNLITHLIGLGADLIMIWLSISTAIFSIFNRLVWWVLAIIGGGFGVILTLVTTGLETVLRVIWAFTDFVLRSFGTMFKNILMMGGKFFDALIHVITTGDIEGGLNILKEAGAKVGQDLLEDWQNTVGYIPDVLGNAIPLAFSRIHAGVTQWKSLIGEVDTGINNFWADTTAKANSVIQTLVGRLTQQNKTMEITVNKTEKLTAGTIILDATETKLNSNTKVLISSIKDLGNAFDKPISKADILADKLDKLASRARRVSGAVSSFGRTGITTATTTAPAYKPEANPFEAVWGKIGKAVEKVNMSIWKGATGGIVTRPTLALIGEAGREAVVPLDRMPMKQVVVNYSPTINMTNEINSEIDVENLKRELSEDLAREVEAALR